MKPAFKGELIATPGLFLIIVAGDLLWSQHVYGDWQCAFAQCRIEVTK